MMVSAEHVSFAYGRNPVLEDVSVSVARGEFVALVGPNGSGKSTLLRILVGLLRPASGRVALSGRLGYVPQRPGLAAGIHATVEDIVRAGRIGPGSWLGWGRRADRAVDTALGVVGLDELRRRPVGELSGGQQQRAFIARALAGEPDVLVLDEPVAGVDAESQRLFARSLSTLVHERGGTVLLVSHELGAVADELDRVVVLRRRVLFDGTPGQLSARGVSLGIHESDLPMWLEGV